MNGICKVCGQSVPLVNDVGVDAIDSHEDRDGKVCVGSGLEPAGEYDDVEE